MQYGISNPLPDEDETTIVSEVGLEVVGTAGDNPFITNVSSPRGVMHAASHSSQALPILYPDKKIVQTGIEYELNKYIDMPRAAHDCVVRGVVGRYFGGLQDDEDIPQYAVLVEYDKDGVQRLDVEDVSLYKSLHSAFGYKLELTDEFRNLGFGSHLGKDTPLAKTRSYGEDGAYRNGMQATIAFISDPSVSYDGYVVSESFAKRGAYPMMTKRVINITRNTIPVNVNGDLDVFKFLPEIGEAVREDGLLCATRQRTDWMSVVDYKTENLTMPDATFDTPVYVPPGSVVVDIKVVRGNYAYRAFPEKITEQLDRYTNMLATYEDNLLRQCERVAKERAKLYGENALQMTPRLSRYIRDATARQLARTQNKVKLAYRKVPVDQYRVEVLTMSYHELQPGNKLSCYHAAKGVITAILPDDQMPVDKYGKRADVMADNNSTVSRMNPGRTYEHFMCALSYDTTIRLRKMLTDAYGPNFLQEGSSRMIQHAREYLYPLYSMINVTMKKFLELANEEEMLAHIEKIMNESLTICWPPNNNKSIVKVIEKIKKSEYAPLMDKVTYTDARGVKRESEDNIRIGGTYLLVLEKTGLNFSAVSSAKLNAMSFPIKPNFVDKTRSQISGSPVKFLSETEVRIMLALCGRKVTADLIDINTNPESHLHLVRRIFSDPNPFSTYTVDRELIPYGRTTTLTLLRSVLLTFGAKIVSTKNAQSAVNIQQFIQG